MILKHKVSDRTLYSSTQILNFMNKFLVSIFFVGTVVLLIGSRFGFTWAGGEGYESPLPVTVEVFSMGNPGTFTLERGSVVKTADNDSAIVKIGEGIFVAMDQRTEIVIERVYSSEVEIILRGGRILAKTSDETKKLTISSPETSDFITSGTVTAVRYDFLNKTEITPLEKFDWQNSTDKNFIVWAAGIMGIGLPV